MKAALTKLPKAGRGNDVSFCAVREQYYIHNSTQHKLLRVVQKPRAMKIFDLNKLYYAAYSAGQAKDKPHFSNGSSMRWVSTAIKG